MRALKKESESNLNPTGEVVNFKNNTKKDLSKSEFYEWLRGFTDGEGSFSIVW